MANSSFDASAYLASTRETDLPQLPASSFDSIDMCFAAAIGMLSGAGVCALVFAVLS